MPVRASLLAALAVFPAAACASAATPFQVSPPAHSATVALSSTRPGTRPVALTLTLGYEMQCGYPGPGPVTVVLPAAEHVPAGLTAAEVLVDGHAAASVGLSAHTVSVGLSPPPQIMCDVIGPGRLTIAFTRSAALGNPARAGSYALEASRGGNTFSAAFTIRPA